MNNWNKQHVASVVGNLNSAEITKINGVFFIKVSEDSEDTGVVGLMEMCNRCGGALAALLYRDYLVNSLETEESNIARVMVENSDKEDSILKVVVLDAKLFQEKHKGRLMFIVGHEIGHHALGHSKLEGGPAFGTEAYNQREVQADEFAAALLGSNDERRECLGFMQEMANKRIAECPPEMATAVLAMLNARINWE